MESGMSWDEAIRGVRVAIPGGWDCEIYLLFTGSIVKSVRIEQTTPHAATLTVWDSCSTDPNPAPIAGAYTTIDAEPGSDRRIAIVPLHSAPLTWLDDHAVPSHGVSTPPVVIASSERTESFERAAFAFEDVGGDAINVVVVIMRAGVGALSHPIRHYTDAIVRQILSTRERTGALAVEPAFGL
jgi:hypothetical protein